MGGSSDLRGWPPGRYPDRTEHDVRTSLPPTPNIRSTVSALLAVGLLCIQFAAIRFAPSDVIVRVVLPVTIAAVPLALWIHRAHVGVWVIFVGLAANLCAILANGGLMPIDRATVVHAVGEERAATYTTGEWVRGSKDILVDGDGRAAALGDQIAIGFGNGGMVVSPGDIVIWAGLVILAAEGSIAWQRRLRQRSAVAPHGATAERGAAT
jgi:hypothetical protein